MFNFFWVLICSFGFLKEFLFNKIAIFRCLNISICDLTQKTGLIPIFIFLFFDKQGPNPDPSKNRIWILDPEPYLKIFSNYFKITFI